MRKADHPRIEVTSRVELRAWLQANHTQTSSIWLVTWKKATPAKHVPYADIVEECLCFGWIDSLPRKLDDMRTMLRLSPRKPSSLWSSLNRRRVAALMDAGLMHPAGIAAVEHAKATGRWEQLETADMLVLPDALMQALLANGNALGNFTAFPHSTKRAILEWILSARTDVTRDKRIRETAQQAAQNIRANQARQPKSAEGAGQARKSK